MKEIFKRVAFNKFCITALFFLFMTGCKKEKPVLPEVNTNEITLVTPVSANCSGNVISAGSSKITEKGLCWSNSSLPTIQDNKVTAVLYPYFESFDLRIGGLNPGVTYYFRAYATSDAGTSYGDELSITSPADRSGETGTITDADGNVYKTIGIGAQIWMAENLKTTRFNDGTDIPQVTGNRDWSLLFTPAYCWYNNDELNNKNVYGALYNWYTVGTGKLCPTGWHVPDKTEWEIIASYLGGAEVAGGKMKIPGTEYWKSPNVGATNFSGFSAFPGGFRWSNRFEYLGENCIFWTSSGNTLTSAWYQVIDELDTELSIGSQTLNDGYSIRCIKNHDK